MPLGVALKIWYTESKRVQRGGKSMEIPNPTEEKAEEKPVEQTEKGIYIMNGKKIWK